MTIGERIIKKRKELNLTQEALGNELNVSRQAVYKWESDGAIPDLDKMIQLSKMFDVSIEWLLGLSENEKSNYNSEELENEMYANIKNNIYEDFEKIISEHANEQTKYYRKIERDNNHIKNIVGVILGLLVGAMVVICLWANFKISSLEQSISKIENSAIGTIDEFKEQMKKANMENEKVLDFSYELEPISGYPNHYKVTVKILPKSGSIVDVLLSRDNGNYSFEGNYEIKGNYYNVVFDDVTIFEDSEWSVTAEFDDAQNEIVGTINGEDALLSMYPDMSTGFDYDNNERKLPYLIAEWEFNKIGSYKVGVFDSKTNKLIEWCEELDESEVPHDIMEKSNSDIRCFRASKKVLSNSNRKNKLIYAAVVKDSYGYAWVYPFYVWEEEGEKSLSTLETYQNVSEWDYE